MFCVDKFLGGLTCCFIRFRGLFGEGMNAAVDICIVSCIIINEGIDYLLWFLRSCSVVEINQVMPIYFLMKYREIAFLIFSTSNCIEGAWRGCHNQKFLCNLSLTN